MGFNSGFKGLKHFCYAVTFIGYGYKQLLLRPCAPCLTQCYTKQNHSEMGTNWTSENKIQK